MTIMGIDAEILCSKRASADSAVLLEVDCQLDRIRVSLRYDLLLVHSSSALSPTFDSQRPPPASSSELSHDFG
jgi:hypothetical protein